MARDKLHKHTLKLRQGDYDALIEYYPEVGAALVIRKLVSRHVDKLNNSTTTAMQGVDFNDDD